MRSVELPEHLLEQQCVRLCAPAVCRGFFEGDHPDGNCFALTRTEESPMRLHVSFEPERHEQRSQEIRKERNAETKQAERLSAILAKKARSAKPRSLTDSAA
jgi:hypothetical protein